MDDEAKTMNESYRLAEEWVVGQIDDELKDTAVPEGSTIDVGELHQCDCVPLDVKDGRGRRWRVSGILWSGNVCRLSGTLTATYECVGVE